MHEYSVYHSNLKPLSTQCSTLYSESTLVPQWLSIPAPSKSGSLSSPSQNRPLQDAVFHECAANIRPQRGVYRSPQHLRLSVGADDRSADWHWSYFQFGAIVHEAARTVLCKPFVNKYFHFSLIKPRRRIQEMWSFIRTQRVCTMLHTQQQYPRVLCGIARLLLSFNVNQTVASHWC